MSRVNQPAFSPDPGKTVNIVATNASANVQWRANTNAHTQHCRVFNSSTVTVFIDFGASGVTAATSTSCPIAAGATEVLRAHGDFVAAITAAAGSNTIYFSPGEGL